MTHCFVDSSALIKRYIPETGTDWVRSITAAESGHTIVVAQMTQIEVISGVARRQREGTILLRTAQAIRLLVDRHTSRDYMVIGMTASIIQKAEDLLQNHPLRAYDSVQLASALEANTRLVTAGLSPLVFVSADTRLLSIAVHFKLAIENPNDHPVS